MTGLARQPLELMQSDGVSNAAGYLLPHHEFIPLVCIESLSEAEVGNPQAVCCMPAATVSFAC